MIQRCTRLAVLGLSLVTAFAAVAGAQTAPTLPSAESMPLHVGPLGLAPSVSITDIGIDSNVKNDAENPQQDFSATIVPRLLARLRMRRLLLSYDGVSDLVYFRKFKSERSANSATNVRLDADLGHLQPFVSAAWLSTKQRMNAELDIRAPRTQRTLGAGARLLVASRTAIVLTARRQETAFDPGVEFQGVELARTLNAHADSGEIAVHLVLTPLTTVGITASVQQDRFDRSPDRNADTFRILPAFQFDPTSLLRGTVAVGYRKFRPLSPALPDYSGLLVQTSVGYTLLGWTRFDLNLQRDVQYSYEETEPYYLTTGGRLTVTQPLVGNLDVQALGGRQTLSYRSAGVGGDTRRDTAEIVGAGLGYRIRDNARLAVNWEYSRRRSPVDQRQYERRRLFASLTLGS